MCGIHDPRHCSLSGVEIAFIISEAQMAADKKQGGATGFILEIACICSPIKCEAILYSRMLHTNAYTYVHVEECSLACLCN
jgi:hypothetical protein